VESTGDEGTVFTVHLPRRAVRPKQDAVAKAKAILIVDDDEDIREVLGLVLQAEGHWVEGAADGLEALDRLRRGNPPSLVLLDLMMPRLDGEGVLRAMSGDPRLSHIPVCIISGHQDARDRAARLGAIGSLVKPIELDQLSAVIDRAAAQAEAWASPG
jgi:CheY-like chemotaxis protein